MKRFLFPLVLVLAMAACGTSNAKQGVEVQPRAAAVDATTSTAISTQRQMKDFASYLSDNVLLRGTKVASYAEMQAAVPFPLPLPSNAVGDAQYLVASAAGSEGAIIVTATDIGQVDVNASNSGDPTMTQDQWAANISVSAAEVTKQLPERGASLEVAVLSKTKLSAMLGHEPLMHKWVVTFFQTGGVVYTVDVDDTSATAPEVLAFADSYAQQVQA